MKLKASWHHLVKTGPVEMDLALQSAGPLQDVISVSSMYLTERLTRSSSSQRTS